MKVCICCGTQTSSRKRICPSCKVPALWRELTEAEIAARNEKQEIIQQAFESLVRERAQ